MLFWVKDPRDARQGSSDDVQQNYQLYKWVTQPKLLVAVLLSTYPNKQESMIKMFQ